MSLSQYISTNFSSLITSPNNHLIQIKNIVENQSLNLQSVDNYEYDDEEDIKQIQRKELEIEQQLIIAERERRRKWEEENLRWRLEKQKKFEEEYYEIHRGEQKHGDHWYLRNETATWEDTFKEEEYDIENKVQGVWDEIQRDGLLIWDYMSILFDMTHGFIDGGKTFDRGFKTLDKDFNFSSFLSNQTLKFVDDEKINLMIYYDFPAGTKIFNEYIQERYQNLMKNINPVELIENIILFLIVTVLTSPGKFTIMSPLFTALMPTAIGALGLLAQIYFNITMNKLWAHGSKYLLGMQLFTIFQYIFMLMLVWNFNLYLYTFRIIRYLVFFEAISFLFLYLMTLGVFLDLYFVKKYLNQKNDIYDLFITLFTGYNLGLFAPTAFINFAIILKELTLNQAAWTKDKDYQEGSLLNYVNIDFLQMFGIDENPHVYYQALKNWGRQFL